MIIGDIEDFAIEAMTEESLKPPSSVWGRLRVWIQGQSIGDYEDPHCGLYTAYASFKEIAMELNSLWADEFINLTDTELWNLLDGSMYGFHGEDEIDIDSLYGDSKDYWSLYSKFNFLTNWGEMFDQDPRGKAFIFKEPKGSIKVLTRPGPKNTVESFSFSMFSFRRIVNEFSSWFEEQEKHLDSKNA